MMCIRVEPCADRPIPRMNATGESPPVPPRGAVTPPATFDDGEAPWIAT